MHQNQHRLLVHFYLDEILVMFGTVSDKSRLITLLHFFVNCNVLKKENENDKEGEFSELDCLVGTQRGEKLYCTGWLMTRIQIF